MRIKFHRRFSAAHRLMGDDTGCERIHGHNYEVVVSIFTDGVGDMVVPHSIVKKSIDYFDHRLILAEDDKEILVQRGRLSVTGTYYTDFQRAEDWIRRVPFNPTTENFAKYLADGLCQEAWEWAHDGNYRKVPQWMRVQVDLKETESIASQASSDMGTFPHRRP